MANQANLIRLDLEYKLLGHIRRFRGIPRNPIYLAGNYGVAIKRKLE